MRIYPAVHYTMGGLWVDYTLMTTVPGLFALGEANFSDHGANRLGGNSLSDLLVFGQRAGEYAAKYAKTSPVVKVNEIQIEEIATWALAPFEREVNAAGENPFQIQSALQEKMQELVGIVRIEKELSEAIEIIKNLSAQAAKASCGGNRGYNPGWHTAIELNNMITVEEAIAVESK
mgnify:CR=1 FL=1